MKKVLTVNRNPDGLAISLETLDDDDKGTGTWIAGPKSWGAGVELKRWELTERQIESIRKELDNEV